MELNASPLGLDNARRALAARQLTTGEANHFDRSHRMRDLSEALERAGRPYTDRHALVLWWLMSHAGRDGVASISVNQLARDRGWDPSNTRRAVRQLRAGGFVVRRRRPESEQDFDYLLPGMVHPGR